MTRTLVLPENVIHEIAFLSDQRTVWRLMGTSRAARKAAEPALRRFLGERRVVLGPPIVDYTFSSPIIPSDNRSTRLPLNDLSHRFESHLAAYPLSENHLRNLVLEARDDSLAGWTLIERLAEQLERLELHFVDRRWVKQGEPKEKPSSISKDNWYRSFDSMDTWSPPLLLLPISFPNLTELVLVATARILPLLDYFRPLIPNLKALTLSCYCGDGGVTWQETERDIKGLERLTIAGYYCMMLALTRIMRDRAPDLRYLILNVDNSKFEDRQHEGSDWIFESTSVSHQLEGIALYGEASWFFDTIQYAAQEAGDRGTDFTSLKTLVLEQQRGGAGENYRLAYPNMCETENRPKLPAITKLVWVDRRLEADSNLLSPDKFCDPSSPSVLYDTDELRLLFEKYPTLEEALWMNDYPPDPFADDFGSASFEQHVICRETRAKWMDKPGDLTGVENREVEVGSHD